MDCGSCSEEIVDTVKAHCNHFYIRANRCSAFYDDMFILRGWRTEEINGTEFELNYGRRKVERQTVQTCCSETKKD